MRIETNQEKIVLALVQKVKKSYRIIEEIL